MGKTKSTLAHWVRNLRTMLEQQGFNPRSLSLAAGLNPTAVRDMLEGRSKFPRYDTAQALAKALGTTAAILMGDESVASEIMQKGSKFGDDLELLTEIISRLTEEIEAQKYRVSPRKFAAITATLFRSLQGSETPRKELHAIRSKIHDFLEYENLREKKRHRYG